MRYLKNNQGQGILLSDDPNLQLYAWCDSDWAACPLTCRSRTAWFIQLCGSHVSWRTRNRTLLSLSSTEVEYRAMADTVSEVIWLQALLGSLGVDCSDSILLHCHSMSAFYLSKNRYSMKMKYVGKEGHFIRDDIVRGVITP